LLVPPQKSFGGSNLLHLTKTNAICHLKQQIEQTKIGTKTIIFAQNFY
jgi:hypothetical protein